MISMFIFPFQSYLERKSLRISGGNMHIWRYNGVCLWDNYYILEVYMSLFHIVDSGRKSCH